MTSLRDVCFGSEVWGVQAGKTWVLRGEPDATMAWLFHTHIHTLKQKAQRLADSLHVHKLLGGFGLSSTRQPSLIYFEYTVNVWLYTIYNVCASPETIPRWLHEFRLVLVFIHVWSLCLCLCVLCIYIYIYIYIYICIYCACIYVSKGWTIHRVKCHPAVPSLSCGEPVTPKVTPEVSASVW